MNSLQPNALPHQQPSPDDEDGINILDLLDVVLDNRWLIVIVTAVAIALGGGYLLLVTPTFEANTLIQIEETKGTGGLGEAAALFDTRSPTAAEIEILRSRLVIGRAVQNLQLELSVTPKYLPVIGQWLARRGTQASNPGVFGLGGYATGNESLKVASFDVPSRMDGRRFTVILNAQGYELQSPEGNSLGMGVIGQTFEFSVDGQTGRLTIAGAVGKAGASFYIVRGSLLSVTEGLQASLSIEEQGRQSGVIRVSLQGADPVLTARILNEVGTLYVRQNVERKAAEAEKSLNFLGIFLPQLRQQVEESENKFNRFRNSNGIFDLGGEAKVVLEQSVKLQTSLFDLQQKRKELEARFTPQHPSIQTIDAQINAINRQLATFDSKAKTLPNVEQDLLRLTRDLKVNNELYVSLLNSSQQLRLVKEGKVGNVRVVDVAAVPERAIKPQRSQTMAVAALLGLLAGLGLAFLRSQLRPGIKDPADIEQHVGLSVFATVPYSDVQAIQARNVKAKVPGIHVLALANPQDAAVESLRSLRTALQFAMLGAANNIVLITGPTPGIGKSFTSVNFASVLGTADKKVLLIDADLRKGHLHQYFGQPRERGLSEVLSGTLKFADAVRRQPVPNVDFLSTGTYPPNPAELLMVPAMLALLQQMAGLYDFIIIDTPPVLAASDVAILAPMVGAVFMVARANVTSLGELQASTKQLTQNGVQPRGVIFNGLDTSKRRYGYGMGYKYGRYRYTDYKY